MTGDQLWLDVPYAEKDAAKGAGARWDPSARRWFAPRAGMTGLERWAALPPVPELLPGEDRGFGSGLFVDLVPDSCWFTNVRSCVNQRDWERLRRMVFGRAGERCEACGGIRDRERKVWLEAHERWAYDDAGRVQTLRRLICLCTSCHRATHFGLAQVRCQDGEALEHLMQVNRWSRSQARAHVDDAFALWQRRSAIDWRLDLTMLTSAGVRLNAPPNASERRGVATVTTSEVRSVEQPSRRGLFWRRRAD
jgi:hypothetical protein